jgi:hypothetical protein
LFGRNAQFFHNLPGLLSHHTQLLSRIPFVFGALAAALGVPPISFCRCSGSFRSSPVHLRLSALDLRHSSLTACAGLLLAIVGRFSCLLVRVIVAG